MIKYGRYDDELFDNDDDSSTSSSSSEENKEIISKSDIRKSVKSQPYRFDDDDESDETDKIGCGCLTGLKVVCSYIKLSDECFETFTEKSMALTLTLFKFIKVLDEFSIALELFIQSSSKIKGLILPR